MQTGGSYMLFKKEMIIDGIKVRDQSDLFAQVSDKLLSLDVVQPSYLEELKKRENIFPTGLQTKTIGVAIPHVDPVNIKTDGVMVVRPDKPVRFQQMGDPSSNVNSEIVFFICSTGGDQQLSTLRSLMDLFNNADFLKQLVESEDLTKELLAWKG